MFFPMPDGSLMQAIVPYKRYAFFTVSALVAVEQA